MSSPDSFTPGVTVTETVNDDGSITTTTVTVHEDGSKTTKRKTKRSRKPATMAAQKTESPAAATASKPRPAPIDSGSMESALDDILNAENRGHKDDEDFERAVRRCIPSEFVLIASQDDNSKAQEAIHATKIFTLPDAIGSAGSVATSALLHLLHKNPELAMGTNSGNGTSVGCLTLLKDLRETIKKETKLKVNPQICSSRPLGPPRLRRGQYAPFHIVPADYNGKKRALLIGIRFLDDIPSQQLKGPHNDVHNIQEFLKKHCGFQMEDMVVLADDGKHTAPTKENILRNFKKLTEVSQPGDVVFIQYSGHGGRMENSKGEGQDPYDNYILPSDYKRSGHILDDDILKDFIKAMPSGVYSTMLVDCCNSGTVADLPYVMKATSLRDGNRSNLGLQIALSVNVVVVQQTQYSIPHNNKPACGVMEQFHSRLEVVVENVQKVCSGIMIVGIIILVIRELNVFVCQCSTVLVESVGLKNDVDPGSLSVLEPEEAIIAVFDASAIEILLHLGDLDGQGNN